MDRWLKADDNIEEKEVEPKVDKSETKVCF
jgi:hypothetical protein